jgi:hypothetical protein
MGEKIGTIGAKVLNVKWHADKKMPCRHGIAEGLDGCGWMRQGSMFPYCGKDSGRCPQIVLNHIYPAVQIAEVNNK